MKITDERWREGRTTRRASDESTIYRVARRGAHSVHLLVRHYSMNLVNHAAAT
jgi:hypothetical protein